MSCIQRFHCKNLEVSIQSYSSKQIKISSKNFEKNKNCFIVKNKYLIVKRSCFRYSSWIRCCWRYIQCWCSITALILRLPFSVLCTFSFFYPTFEDITSNRSFTLLLECFLKYSTKFLNSNLRCLPIGDLSAAAAAAM